VGNTAYPGIAEDYERGFQVLKSLPCDIFLGAHGAYYDLETKYARMKTAGVAAFVDPDGYATYVADRERAFRDELAKQKRGRPYRRPSACHARRAAQSVCSTPDGARRDARHAGIIVATVVMPATSTIAPASIRGSDARTA